MKAAYYDPCPAFATFDGLAIDWVQKQKLFVNPPFGKAMDAFCRKCMETFLEAKHQQAFFIDFLKPPWGTKKQIKTREPWRTILTSIVG